MKAHPLSLEKNRGLYLGFFFFSNLLIAHSALPLGFKLTLGLFGIFLPLYVAVRTSSFLRPKDKPDSSMDLKLGVPLWLLLTGIVLAIFLRFYKLTTLFCWPTLDEAWNGILAIELSKHWNWRFFYTFGDAPPLPVWCAAFLFKDGSPPAIALWFPSAVVSCLTVFSGHFAARQFFSKSFAWVLGGLLAFSYWPLFIGRFCHQGIWLPLWVCFFLYLWGKLQNAKKDRKIWATASGVALGLGSFTFTPWLGVAGLLFLWAFWTLWLGSWTPWHKAKTTPSPLEGEGRVRGKKYFLWFLSGFAFSLIPFLLAALREGYGHHIRSLSPWGGTFHEFQLLTNFLKYFAVLVWGAYEKEPAYTPVWGGFLNPLLGAFFFLGIAEMVRFWRRGIVQWVGAFFLLFLAPGALSPNLETFRVAQVMPLLLVIVAFGAHSFVASFSPTRRVWALAGILAFTGAFDFNQLAKPYRDPKAHPENFGRPLKSIERYESYRLLKHWEPARSLVHDLDTESMNDPTLLVMTYPNLPAELIYRGNPQAPVEINEDPAKPSLAFLVDSHYQPFLEGRFPPKSLYPLKAVERSVLLSPLAGRNMLGEILSSGNALSAYPRWKRTFALFQGADLARFSQNSGPLVKPVSILAAGYPLVKGDPFLESVYWDKMAAYAYEDGNYEIQLKCYQNAVTRGYPTADLYNKLGQMYLVGGRTKEAKEALLKATKAPMDHTNAKKVLEWMAQQEKRPSSP